MELAAGWFRLVRQPMSYDPEKHHRRSVRLKGYDYSQPGAYFITICAVGRLCLFGDVVNDAMVLNELGVTVDDCWRDLPTHYPHVSLDAFVIMPNHIHMIIVLLDDTAVGPFRPGWRTRETSSPP
jgi:putative transposase